MSVSRLEELLASVALRADARGRRRLWRLHRAVRGGAALGQEMLLRWGRRRGRMGVDPDLAWRAQSAPVKAVLRYPAFWPAADSVSPATEALARGLCLLRDGTTVALDSVSWRRDRPGGGFDVSTELFHALHWVRELVDAYGLTRNRAYLDRGKALAERWMDECLYTERWSHVWDPHATGFRAIILCQMWAACRESEPPGSPFMRDLLAAIVRHAEKLERDRFYHADHNHGMAQAYALFMIGLLFREHRKAPAWTDLGRARLEAQMRDNVSAEGLHREHSPYYQFFVFQQFYFAYQLAQAYGLKFSPAYVERLNAMLAASAYLLKPDGSLPALGDTYRSSPILLDKHDLEEWPLDSAKEYLFSSTRGAEGTPPPATSALFPEGGVAIFRSGWGARDRVEDERFLAFRLATFGSAHIHRDVFTFELYAYGDDLIVDSAGPYEYGHPIRMGYFLSTTAHNTVVVDGADQRVGQARVLHWSTSPAVDVLVAEHENVPGVSHRRAVLFVRPSYFVILDRLEARNTHRYAQLFHLNPVLQVTLDCLAVSTANPAAGPTVKIVPLGEDGLELRLHRGAVDPRQGWVCVGPKRMVPNSVVEYQRSARTASFATVIMPERPGKPTWVRGAIEGSPFREEARICVAVGDQQDDIILSPTGEVTVRRARDGR